MRQKIEINQFRDSNQVNNHVRIILQFNVFHVEQRRHLNQIAQTNGEIYKTIFTSIRRDV